MSWVGSFPKQGRDALSRYTHQRRDFLCAESFVAQGRCGRSPQTRGGLVEPVKKV